MCDYTKKNKSATNYFKKRPTKNLYNFFFRLDCQSGEGLVNPLLTELEKISNIEFEFYLKFILKKCINVNRSFSDAIKFLSIWLEKSPGTLLRTLQTGKLNHYFNRTEYGHEGNQWYFPELLQRFKVLINQTNTASKILDCLFQTFDFFSEQEIFVREIIGYDRLQLTIEECPPIFKQALVLKIKEFIEQNNTIDLGLYSHKYLNEEVDTLAIKAQPKKETERQELILYLRENFFKYPSLHNDDPHQSDISLPQSIYFRENSRI